MPSPNQGERIRILEANVSEIDKQIEFQDKRMASLETRLDSLQSIVQAIRSEVDRLILTVQMVVEEVKLIRQHDTALALLRRDVDELRQTRDEWSRRIWALAGPLLGAVVGAILGYSLRRN